MCGAEEDERFVSAASGEALVHLESRLCAWAPALDLGSAAGRADHQPAPSAAARKPAARRASEVSWAMYPGGAMQKHRGRDPIPSASTIPAPIAPRGSPSILLPPQHRWLPRSGASRRPRPEGPWRLEPASAFTPSEPVGAGRGRIDSVGARLTNPLRESTIVREHDVFSLAAGTTPGRVRWPPRRRSTPSRLDPRRCSAKFGIHGQPRFAPLIAASRNVP